MGPLIVLPIIQAKRRQLDPAGECQDEKPVAPTRVRPCVGEDAADELALSGARSASRSSIGWKKVIASRACGQRLALRRPVVSLRFAWIVLGPHVGARLDGFRWGCNGADVFRDCQVHQLEHLPSRGKGLVKPSSFMRAVRSKAAFCQHQNHVGPSQKAQPIGDDERGSASPWRGGARTRFHVRSLESTEAVGSSRIRIGGCRQERARKGQALTLAARKVDARFAQDGFVALRAEP